MHQPSLQFSFLSFSLKPLIIFLWLLIIHSNSMPEQWKQTLLLRTALNLGQKDSQDQNTTLYQHVAFQLWLDQRKGKKGGGRTFILLKTTTGYELLSHIWFFLQTLLRRGHLKCHRKRSTCSFLSYQLKLINILKFSHSSRKLLSCFSLVMLNRCSLEALHSHHHCYLTLDAFCRDEDLNFAWIENLNYTN